MREIYCTKKPKISYICDGTLLLSSICSKCASEDENIFIEEESIEMLKILCLITNIEKYQKIYNHV